MGKGAEHRSDSPTSHERWTGASLERTAVSLSLALFLVHLWHALAVRSERLLLPSLVSWFQDVLVLVTLMFATRTAAHVIGDSFHVNRPARIVSVGILISVATLLSLYPAQLSNFLAFPVNVLKVDRETTSFFFKEYLGWSVLWHPPVFLLLAFALFRVLPQRVVSTQMRWTASVICILGFISLGRPAPHPFVYSLQDTLKQWAFSGERVVPSLKRPTQERREPAIDSSALTPIDTGAELRYSHVLLLVLEGVNSSSFENDFLRRPGGYFEKIEQRSTYFPMYYATNIDSYTSLICMLTSVTVPYRAYADAASYDKVNSAPNIVRSLRRRGFKTFFCSTYEYQPFVPVRGDWDRIADNRDLPLQEKMVSVGTNKMESATEDMAALSTILNFIRSNEHTFVLHELVYGHSPEWTMKTGIPQLRYYDRFLRTITTALDSLGLGSQALVIVVSDHGPRDDSAAPQNYHVPLLITGSSIAGGSNSTFLSHKNLPSIICRYLVGAVVESQAVPVYVVGSTEKWIYGEFTPEGLYLFIDNESGTVLRTGGLLSAAAVHSGFQNLLDEFAARFQLGYRGAN